VAGADLAAHLRGGLLGVAVGEALGLPWAGVSPRRITRRALYEGVGPTGAATAAVLAAARAGGAAGGGASAGGAASAHGTASTAGGGASARATRDALPRALAAGWRHGDPDARRAAAMPLGVSAVVVADLAAWALAGRPLHHLVDDHAHDWPPPFYGVTADDRSVVDALLAVLQRHDDPTEGMRAAVRLGGGGAAVLTALVGGILAGRRPTAIARVPWLERVALPDDATLDAALAALATRGEG
jgi:RecA/RadA recombinase